MTQSRRPIFCSQEIVREITIRSSISVTFRNLCKVDDLYSVIQVLDVPPILSKIIYHVSFREHLITNIRKICLE